MNKNALILVIIIVISAFGGLAVYKFFDQGKVTENKVMEHIQAQGYDASIKSEKTIFEPTNEIYYVQVVYKDEPDHRYEYYLAERGSSKPPVYVIGYNKDGDKIKDKTEGKYIEK